MSKYLIIVDMQNDFVGGSLKNEEALKIVPNIVNKIKSFDGNVIFTRDTHFDNYMDTQEGSLLPVPHCIKNTDGWQIIDELQPFVKDNQVYNKITFGSKDLAADFYKKNSFETIDEIELIGVCTDICVVSNAILLKAFLPEVKITVDSSCCAGVSVESHLNALNTMKSCQINVI